jgi:hypothetical protein
VTTNSRDSNDGRLEETIASNAMISSSSSPKVRFILLALSLKIKSIQHSSMVSRRLDDGCDGWCMHSITVTSSSTSSSSSSMVVVPRVVVVAVGKCHPYRGAKSYEGQPNF